MALARPPRRRPLSVLVVPLGLETIWVPTARRSAILFIADPESAHPTAHDQLRNLYSLPPAETAVALRIARGEGLKAVADQLGIGLTTARNHLEPRLRARPGLDSGVREGRMVSRAALGHETDHRRGGRDHVRRT
jgi:FixJ family two-component response regulator